MINNNLTIQHALLSSVREFNGKVEHYRNSTLQHTFNKNDYLQSIEIQRVAENSRFFGMLICQRINVKVRDTHRVIDIQSGDKIIPYIGAGNDFIAYPTFTITEINRNERTNQLSITGYDLIDSLKSHLTAEILPTPPYTLNEFVALIAGSANTTHRIENVSDLYPFNINYGKGANFEGTETLYEALQAAAEATQCIVFVDNQDRIVFKRLSPNETEAFTITKSLYTELISKTNRRLVGICHTTILGDNVEASDNISGTVQYVRDNPFWELRDDINTIVDNALSAVGGLTINQFTCSWVGNLFLEIGDKVALITKDNQTVYSYILDDVITFDGSLSEKTQWHYADEEFSESNPTSIGDAVKETYARVDKQEKKITLLASDISDVRSEVGSVTITTNNITSTVSSQQTTLDTLSNEIQSIRNQVSSTMTDEQIRIAIQQAVENSVNQVVTETGFTFDKDGLTISKTGSEMTTIIDEDGLDVKRGYETVLTADSRGVNAINLTARQYLTIGTRSRFEDYKYDRTACFWIK